MFELFKTANTQDRVAEVAAPDGPLDRWLPWIFCASAIFMLFFELGEAALFEPDEGRNAEKAREILLLKDWLTPHENFHPVLDKPIFFYWLIAFCYRLFGISEWAARLPSALAALGCVAAIYYFARAQWGHWQALWAGLILLTSLEFFLLARIVIFDMSLTLALTLALGAFYLASHTDDVKRRKILCLLMYGGLGVATLIKGLVGIVVLGMVICCYLWLTKQWSVLRRLYLVPGTLLFLAIVLPWYLEMGSRHEGYLRYFFWDEHFARFATGSFGRGEPWYYYILVGLIGFFPWSLLLPFIAGKCRRTDIDGKTLFVILWIAVPFLFFSFSKSKLPHYILPIFPPLAILTAALLVRLYRQSAGKMLATLSLIWAAQGLIACYFIVGAFWPRILPYPVRSAVGTLASMPWTWALAVICWVAFLYGWLRLRPMQRPSTYYLAQLFTMILFLVFGSQLIVASSAVRSAKKLADKAAPMITPATQVVFYDTYLAGMLFYLRSVKPIWMVTYSGKKKTFLGNYYVLTGREEPVSPWGQALMDFDEFGLRWRSARQPMVIFVKEKNQRRLEKDVGAAAKTVGSFDEYIVLHKP